MREALTVVALTIAFGLLCAAYFAGAENERLAQLGVGECDTYDCWE